MIFKSIEYTVPDKLITNDQVIENFRRESSPYLTSDELAQVESWTRAAFESTGTNTRYQCNDDQLAFELCVDTAKRALIKADLDRLDIDLLIYTGIGRGFIEPASANIFIDLLGLENATGYDLLDACASWVRALDVARLFVESGRYKNVMIVNAEFSTQFSYRYKLESITEFAHWYPGLTIGEAATATIISSSQEEDDFNIDFRTWGEKRNLCFVALHNFDQYMGCETHDSLTVKPLQFVSFGMPLLFFGATKIVEQYQESAQFHCEPAAIFGHAASDGMSKFVLGKCNLDETKFHYMHHRYGNTVSSSVPLAMAVARDEGNLKNGDEILIFVASAGVTTSLCKLKYYS
jgi:3-oxoacyl-[acyl-carrier-protein] synthase III